MSHDDHTGGLWGIFHCDSKQNVAFFLLFLKIKFLHKKRDLRSSICLVFPQNDLYVFINAGCVCQFVFAEDSQAGSGYHNSFVDHSSGLDPRVSRSAGFSFDFIYFHSHPFVDSCISAILTETNFLNNRQSFFMPT